MSARSSCGRPRSSGAITGARRRAPRACSSTTASAVPPRRPRPARLAAVRSARTGSPARQFTWLYVGAGLGRRAARRPRVTAGAECAGGACRRCRTPARGVLASARPCCAYLRRCRRRRDQRGLGRDPRLRPSSTCSSRPDSRRRSPQGLHRDEQGAANSATRLSAQPMAFAAEPVHLLAQVPGVHRAARPARVLVIVSAALPGTRHARPSTVHHDVLTTGGTLPGRAAPRRTGMSTVACSSRSRPASPCPASSTAAQLQHRPTATACRPPPARSTAPASAPAAPIATCCTIRPARPAGHPIRVLATSNSPLLLDPVAWSLHGSTSARDHHAAQARAGPPAVAVHRPQPPSADLEEPGGPGVQRLGGQRFEAAGPAAPGPRRPLAAPRSIILALSWAGPARWSAARGLATGGGGSPIAARSRIPADGAASDTLHSYVAMISPRVPTRRRHAEQLLHAVERSSSTSEPALPRRRARARGGQGRFPATTTAGPSCWRQRCTCRCARVRLPGESIIDFMEALGCGIEVVSAVRQGMAAFMAEARTAFAGRVRRRRRTGVTGRRRTGAASAILVLVPACSPSRPDRVSASSSSPTRWSTTTACSHGSEACLRRAASATSSARRCAPRGRAPRCPPNGYADARPAAGLGPVQPVLAGRRPRRPARRRRPGR